MYIQLLLNLLCFVLQTMMLLKSDQQLLTVNMRIAFLLGLQTCFMLNLLNWTIIYI